MPVSRDAEQGCHTQACISERLFHKNIGQWPPWFRRIPRAVKQLGHAPWLLNPRSGARMPQLPRPVCLEPVPCRRRSHHTQESMHRSRHCRKACRQPRRPSKPGFKNTWHSVTILVTAVPLYTIPFLKLCAQGKDPGSLTSVPALSSGIWGLGLHSQSNDLAEKLLFQTHFYIPAPHLARKTQQKIFI